MTSLILCLAALPLWFCADFDQPSELGGSRFEQNMRAGRVADGRFGKGYAFESPLPRAEHAFWEISDPERLKDFPWREGAFACWFKGGDPSKVLNPFFSFGGFWSFEWALSGSGFNASKARGAGVTFKPAITGTNVWRHIAATWSEARLAVYLDGRLVAEKAKPVRTDMRGVKRAVLRFGTGGEGRPASGLVLDDIAVFARALTADEVQALATASAPLRAPGTANPPSYDPFTDVAAPPPEGTFVLQSWGGSVGESRTFRKTMGLNCINVRAEDIATARACAQEGFFLNVRVENSGAWKTRSEDEIRRRLETLLGPYRNLKNWRTTLVNSEVYGLSGIRVAVSNAVWRERATRALGSAPELGFGYAPPSLDYRKLGVPAPSGVLPDDCRSLNTLNWFLSEGDPVFRINRLDAEVIRALRPDVLVWSEPSPPAFGLDMLADWIYDYGTDFCLYNFRRMGAKARAEGVKSMPTLSGSYHHSWEPHGRHPSALDKKGKPLRVKLAQSCDETIVKTWMALGATRADALSYFNAGLWEKGAANAAAFAADPSNAVTCVAEPDFAERYGRFIREKFLPVAAKLRGCPAARAKLAFAPLPESLHAGTERWRPVHYHAMIGTCLSRGPVAFDVLDEREIRPEILAQYRYVVVPMLGGVITKGHYEALCAVSNTTTVIADSYCTVKFPNVEKLNTSMHYAWTVAKAPPERELAALNAWLAAHADELHRDAFAWSDRDGKDAFTFVKELPDGGKAVLVVNDARADRSLWPQFCDDPRYRPVAAPNRIAIHFNLPGGERVETHDFAPTEAKLFVFDGRPAAQAADFKLAVSTDRIDGLYAAGETATVSVSAKNKDGALIRNGRIDVRVDNFGAVSVTNLTVDFAVTNPFSFRVTRPDAGFLRVHAGETRCGVGFDVTHIAPGTPNPSDFAAFWRDAIAQYDREIPSAPECRVDESLSDAEWIVERVTLDAPGGRKVYGFVSRERNAKGRIPARVEISAAGYGTWSQCPTKARGRITLKMTVYPFEPDVKLGKKSEYDAGDKAAQRRWGVKRYCHGGISESREAYFFHPVILANNRAIDWFAARSDVDSSRIDYMGTSQGGGLGLAAMALNGNFARGCVFVPALTDLLGFRAGNRQSGWPDLVASHPAEARAAVERNAPYFCGVNFARMITIPIRFVVGHVDQTCSPNAVYSAFNVCPSTDKAIVGGVGMGHGVFGDYYSYMDAWSRGCEIERPQVRFLAFNIWGDYFGNPVPERAPGIVALVKRWNTDIAGFQEMTPRFWKSALVAELEKDYAFVGRGLGVDGHDVHTPVLYRRARFDLVESGIVLQCPELDESKGAVWAVLKDKATGRKIVAFASHAWWRYDGKGDDWIRLNGAMMLAEKLHGLAEKHGAAVVGGGDLNAPLESGSLKWLLAHGYADAQASAEVSPRGFPTEHGDPKRGPDGKYVGRNAANGHNRVPEKFRYLDHIFFDPDGVAARRFDIDISSEACRVSDHHPIVLDFDLR